MSFLRCVLFLAGFIWASNSLSINQKVEYYKNLWAKNLNESLEWKRPQYNHEFKNKNPWYCKEYGGNFDFVIVGAGGSGAVLANRLSEREHWRVLLIEAGGDESDFSLMPGGYLTMQNSKLNWGYLTTPQKHACKAMINNQCPIGRGKALGGETALNENTYVRGNKRDFDNWEALGNKGWSFDDVLPYFIKMENMSGFDGDAGYHGVDGPLSVTYAVPPTVMQDNILGAHRELNYRTLDYNGKEQLGASRIQVNTHNGKRHSTNQAYLQPILNTRSNLIVKRHTFATKITFSSKNRVKGINFINNNICYHVTASKEIIISAGTINSAQLLMLSGIGPKEELRKHKIPIVADLPVGMNYEDHIAIMNVAFNTNYTVPQNTLDQDFRDYINGRGRMASPVALQVGFRTLGKSNTAMEMMHSLQDNYNDGMVIKKQTNWKDEMFFGAARIDSNAITTHVVLLHPKSRGTVTLKSKDPLDYPLINPNYLKEKDDVDMLVNAVESVLELLNTDSMRAINATLADNSIPPCRNLTGSDFWRCKIPYAATSFYHSIGTCRMGNDTRNSVVNHRLHVHGFVNLRVVDAGVIPSSTSGSTNPLATMIAEKISDDIKKAYS